MLEFNYPPMVGSHICDMSFAVFSRMDNLLPVVRELVFPIAMPFGFVLPPTVAEGRFPLMSPVPDSDLSAPCNHRLFAAAALARKIGPSLLALPIDESELHEG